MFSRQASWSGKTTAIRSSDAWRSSGAGYGSLWLVRQALPADPTPRWVSRLGLDAVGFSAGTVTTLAVLGMLLAVVVGLLLGLASDRRPRVAQLAFVVLAIVVVTGKAWPVQASLWLLPLAALARPRWRDFLVWQACEVLYFLGIWSYLAYTTGGNNKGLPQGGYHLAIAAHLLGTLYLCAVVVRDMLMAERDPVRQDGSDDPSGGVLDGAPDVFVLGRARTPREAPPRVTPVEWGTEYTARR